MAERLPQQIGFIGQTKIKGVHDKTFFQAAKNLPMKTSTGFV
jgi:hypothetical protein